jgi:hypothetical protein
LIAIGILCWAVLASFGTGYYYYQYTSLSEKLTRLPVHVSVSIDYGNSTIEKIEDIYLFRNSTVLDALRAIANDLSVEYWSGWGTIIRSINGMANEGMVGWQYWVNEEYGTVAVDLYILVNGDEIEFRYASFGG